MYKISIIIPVYNAESSLKNTVDSIINQTLGFDNIELILVDDCSTDNSKKIIESYAKNHKNIKPIFLKQNSGSASHPRNKGIEYSTAKYLMFVDNDDELFEDYCEVLLDKITKNDVQIVNCNYTSKLKDSLYITKLIENIDFTQKVCDDVDKMFLIHTVWANIYESSLIKNNGIVFPNSLYEDGVFSISCLLKTNKPVIHLPNYPGYIYDVGNEDSLSKKSNLKLMSSFLKGFKLCDELLKEHKRFDVEKSLMGTFTNMAIFILLKMDNLDEAIKMLYDFEKSFDFEINLDSMPLEIINSKIRNKQFLQAKILLKIMRIFYNNQKIRNYVYRRYGNLKPLMER